jgi:Na+/proline symporter
MYWFSSSLVVVNLLFLGLGALLYLFAESQSIDLPEQRDYLFPMIAMDGYLGDTVAVMFILGLVAAAYSSADSALTSLTTGFSIDILNIDKFDREKRRSIRKWVHVGMSLVLIMVISIFKEVNNDSVVSELFTAAGFTYGPLLGMYAFGLFTKWSVNDRKVLPVVIGAPILSYVFKLNSAAWLSGYEPGFEILLINGLLTFLGLFLIRSKS